VCMRQKNCLDSVAVAVADDHIGLPGAIFHDVLLPRKSL
jgi:hypothetical protein